MSKRAAHEGSIYQRDSDGRWVAALRLSSGGRRVVYATTQRDARRKLDALRRAEEQGLPLPSERLTVGAYLASWLDAQRTRVRPATWVTYDAAARLLLVPHLGRLSLARLSAADVRRMCADLLASGTPPATVTYTLIVLRMALSWAVRDGELVRNVATLVEPPRTARVEMRPFMPDEARRFLAAANGHRLQALYTVALALGLRQGEALALRWGDVDLEGGTLAVRHTLANVPRALRGDGQRLALAEPKTNRSRRTVRLPAIVASALREHRKRQVAERLLAGSRWHVADLAFTTTIGTPLDRRNVTQGFQLLLAQAGLPRLRFHDLRHSCATLLLAQGVPARVVMELLGHSDIGTTLGVYSHVVPALQREAADRIDAALG